MVGDLPGYSTFWYQPTGIANILSLSRDIKIFTITYDSANGNKFRMHKENVEDRLFRQSEIVYIFGTHALSIKKKWY